MTNVLFLVQLLANNIYGRYTHGGLFIHTLRWTYCS